MNALRQILTYLSKGRMPPPGLIPDAVIDGFASLASVRGRFSQLTPTERLLTTMRHKEPDRVPCATLVGGAYRQLTGASFADFSQDPDIALEAGALGARLIGGDVHLLGLDLSVEATDFGQPVVYPENSTAHPDYDKPLLRDWSDYRGLKRIDVSRAERMQKVIYLARRAVEEMGRSGVLAVVVSSPLSVLGMMRSAEKVFKDCVLHRAEVLAALEVITEVLGDYVSALCDAGLIVIVLDMLYAARSGLGKQLWEEIEGPFGRQLADVVRSKNCVVGIHNCGDGPYFDSMISFMEPEAISFARLPDDCRDHKELKERYGDQTTLIGNVETSLLYRGTPRDVTEACRRLIDDLADGGGFVLAPGCEYPPNADLFNAVALVRAAEMYG